MCTSRPSHESITMLQELSYKRRLFNVDLSGLNNVVEVDEERREVTVEPGVTIGRDKEGHDLAENHHR